MNFVPALQTLAAPTPDVNLTLVAPETIVSLAGVVVMLVDAYTRRANRPWLTGTLSLAGLAAAAAFCLWAWGSTAAGQQFALHDMIVLDRMRLSFTLVFVVVAALTVFVSMIWVEWERLPAGEFHALL
ncbi:MAG: hypothetical protein ABR563_08000, partial [Pyrinomonadaceae bacterium]